MGSRDQPENPDVTIKLTVDGVTTTESHVDDHQEDKTAPTEQKENPSEKTNGNIHLVVDNEALCAPSNNLVKDSFKFIQICDTGPEVDTKPVLNGHIPSKKPRHAQKNGDIPMQEVGLIDKTADEEAGEKRQWKATHSQAFWCMFFLLLANLINYMDRVTIAGKSCQSCTRRHIQTGCFFFSVANSGVKVSFVWFAFEFLEWCANWMHPKSRKGWMKQPGEIAQEKWLFSGFCDQLQAYVNCCSEITAKNWLLVLLFSPDTFFFTTDFQILCTPCLFQMFASCFFLDSVWEKVTGRGQDCCKMTLWWKKKFQHWMHIGVVGRSFCPSRLLSLKGKRNGIQASLGASFRVLIAKKKNLQYLDVAVYKEHAAKHVVYTSPFSSHFRRFPVASLLHCCCCWENKEICWRDLVNTTLNLPVKLSSSDKFFRRFSWNAINKEDLIFLFRVFGRVIYVVRNGPKMQVFIPEVPCEHSTWHHSQAVNELSFRWIWNIGTFWTRKGFFFLFAGGHVLVPKISCFSRGKKHSFQGNGEERVKDRVIVLRRVGSPIFLSNLEDSFSQQFRYFTRVCRVLHAVFLVSRYQVLRICWCRWWQKKSFSTSWCNDTDVCTLWSTSQNIMDLLYCCTLISLFHCRRRDLCTVEGKCTIMIRNVEMSLIDGSQIIAGNWLWNLRGRIILGHCGFWGGVDANSQNGLTKFPTQKRETCGCLWKQINQRSELEITQGQADTFWLIDALFSRCPRDFAIVGVCLFNIAEGSSRFFFFFFF